MRRSVSGQKYGWPVAGLLAVLAASGCANDAIPVDSDDSAEEAKDPILEGLQAGGTWELAPHKAVISDEPATTMA